MKSKRPTTQNAGAALERQAIREWVRRRLTIISRDTLLAYLDGRTERNRMRAGGLGTMKPKPISKGTKKSPFRAK